MNLEGRGEILLLAVFFSAGIHFGTMYYAKPKVMTHVVSASVRAGHREAMRVSKTTLPESPVKIDVVKDVDALKDAPVAEEVQEIPPAPIEADMPSATVKSVVPASLMEVPNAPEPSADLMALDVKPLSSERSSVALRLPPPPEMGMPKVSAIAAAPEATPPLPRPAIKAVPPPPPALEISADEEFGPEKILPIEKEQPKAITPKAFTPEQEIREKVDEQLVANEKEAVRKLLDVAAAEELKPYIDMGVTKFTFGGWTYFKIQVAPKTLLPLISKDVVLLIDASGSIGKDRIRSIREAAKGILRTCTNSGDRFNLVAFRDKYTYAFRRWQECSQSSFNTADKWLDNVAAHGRTDVFASIRSVLTLPRDPLRPLIAMVITDGDANSGVRETSQILSKFTALNDGLISVYMYGVKGSANRELIDVLTRGNRGESFIYDGWRWSAGSGIENLGVKFRDPVLSDLRVVFAVTSQAEAYPRLLRNLYRGEVMEVFGRVPAKTREVAFSIKGLNGKDPYEGFFKLPLDAAKEDSDVMDAWNAERQIDLKLK